MMYSFYTPDMGGCSIPEDTLLLFRGWRYDKEKDMYEYTFERHGPLNEH